MQASFAPDARKAAISASKSVAPSAALPGKPSLVTASIPPASNKFFAHIARAVNAAGGPRLARKMFGRAPVSRSRRSDRSRSRS